MVKLILVRGLPGSGKTTFAMKKKYLLRDAGENVVTIAADDFMVDSQGAYRYNPSRLRECHSACFRFTELMLVDGFTVIVHNTFTRVQAEMQNYINLANRLEIPLEVIRMTTQYRSVHNVPADVMKTMKDRFQDYPGEIYV